MLYGTETTILQRQKTSLKVDQLIKVNFKHDVLYDLATKSNGFLKTLGEVDV